MEIETWQAECLALIEAMPSTQEFGVAHRQLYGFVLRHLGEDLSRAAVQEAALTCRWRPSPAELRELAVHQAVPLPDASEVIAEIAGLLESVGLYGVVHPENPRVRLPGAPPMSPLATEVVRRLGGWERLCTEPTEGRVPWEKSAKEAHREIVTKIEREGLTPTPAIESGAVIPAQINGSPTPTRELVLEPVS